jgi:hypothetical protein
VICSTVVELWLPVPVVVVGGQTMAVVVIGWISVVATVVVSVVVAVVVSSVVRVTSGLV